MENVNQQLAYASLAAKELVIEAWRLLGERLPLVLGI